MKLKGVLFSVLSAVIFGTSPIFFKTIVTLGINTTTQVVLRSIVTMVLRVCLRRSNASRFCSKAGCFLTR